jgi:hypothetical protein
VSALIINFHFVSFSFFIFVIACVLWPSLLLTPLRQALWIPRPIDRDAAIYRDASMLQLEKFTTEAKALTADRTSIVGRHENGQAAQGGHY